MSMTGLGGGWNSSGTSTGGVTTLGGTPNFHSKFITPTSIGDSLIEDDGTDITAHGTIFFDNGLGIDVLASGGADVLSVGVNNADTINYGYSGTTHNFFGTTINQNVTNLNVKDKLITINDGGAAASGGSSGFEIEEGGIITGYFIQNATRDGFDFQASAITGVATFSLANLTANRTATLQDASGTLAYLSDITAGWNLDGNTVGSEKFIGTIDDFNFPIRTNNVERLRVTNAGGTWNDGVNQNIDVTNRNLYNSSGTTVTVDWEGKTLSVPISGVTVDWGNYLLIDGNAKTSVDWISRALYDGIGANLTSIEWQNRLLRDDLGNLSVEWNGTVKRLSDNSGTEALDWSNRLLIPNTGSYSLDWQNRNLVNTSSQNVLYWGSSVIGVYIKGLGSTSATYGLQVHDESGVSNTFVVRDDGRVGINKSTPSAQLDISDTGTTTGGLYITGSFGANMGSISNVTAFQHRGLNISADSVIVSAAYQPTVGIGIAAARTTPLVSINNNSRSISLVIEHGQFAMGVSSASATAHIMVNTRTGTGTITSSGTTVTGSGTSFTTELAVGDTITAQSQTRTITAIASDTSLTVSSAFSPNIVIGVALNYEQPILRLADNNAATKFLFYNGSSLAMFNGIAPTFPSVDGFHLYSDDIVAGNAAPHFRTENGSIVKLFRGAAVADAAGGVVIDAEARTAINSLLARMRVTGGNGLIAD